MHCSTIRMPGAWRVSVAGERGRQIARELPFGQSMAWSIVVRTVLMDEIILRCIAHGARSVVNLGAGLDTRAFRLPLSADLYWFDFDLPDMVAHRYQQEAIKCDSSMTEKDSFLEPAITKTLLCSHFCDQ